MHQMRDVKHRQVERRQHATEWPKVLKAIEEQFPDRRFPIVVLTSRTEMEHRDWTRSIDNLTFMEKPVSVRRLLSQISKSLGEPSVGAA